MTRFDSTLYRTRMKCARKIPDYLSLEWGHVLPSVGPGIISLDTVQLFVVVTTPDSVDEVVHDADAVICVLLL